MVIFDSFVKVTDKLPTISCPVFLLDYGDGVFGTGEFVEGRFHPFGKGGYTHEDVVAWARPWSDVISYVDGKYSDAFVEKRSDPQTFYDFRELGYGFEISSIGYFVKFQGKGLGGASSRREFPDKRHWKIRRKDYEDNAKSALRKAQEHYNQNKDKE